jgi:hypothetical protein
VPPDDSGEPENTEYYLEENETWAEVGAQVIVLRESPSVIEHDPYPVEFICAEPPDFFDDNTAHSVLEELKEKGTISRIEGHYQPSDVRWFCKMYGGPFVYPNIMPMGQPFVGYATGEGDTMAEAVCDALLKMQKDNQ